MTNNTTNNNTNYTSTSAEMAAFIEKLGDCSDKDFFQFFSLLANKFGVTTNHLPCYLDSLLKKIKHNLLMEEREMQRKREEEERKKAYLENLLKEEKSLWSFSFKDLMLICDHFYRSGNCSQCKIRALNGNGKCPFTDPICLANATSEETCSQEKKEENDVGAREFDLTSFVAHFRKAYSVQRKIDRYGKPYISARFHTIGGERVEVYNLSSETIEKVIEELKGHSSVGISERS